jgi:hypothetical protein
VFRHTFRHMVHVLGALVAGLVIILSLFAWRLSSGPISLGFLSPTFESVLSSNEQGVRVRLQDTILTWAGWDRTLDIRVLNVSALGNNGAVLTTIPELSLSLSAKALFRGLIAPKRIELFHPKIKLLRKTDGRIQFGFGEKKTKSNKSADFIKFIIAELLKKPDPGDRLSYLDQVGVFDADLTLIDETLGLAWHAPSSQVSLVQNEDGLEAEAIFALDIGKQKAEFVVLSQYQPARKKLSVGIRFDKVVPAMFSHLESKMAPLADLRIPLGGSIDVGMSIDGDIDTVGFNLTGGSGKLALPEPVKQNLKIKQLDLKGRYYGKEQRVQVEQFAVDLGNNGSFSLPLSANHQMPLRSVKAQGQFELKSERIVMDAVNIDFHGPTATVKGSIEGIGDSMEVQVKSVAHNVPVDELRRYWPRAWGTAPHKWSTSHLSDGVIKEIRANVVMQSSGPNQFDVKTLEGEMDIRGATIDYLAPMPKIRRVDANGTFNKKRFDFDILYGEALNLKIKKGTAHLTHLDQRDQFADIDLTIEGPVQSALKLTETEPIGFQSSLGFTSKGTRGHSSTRLRLNFPLEEALTLPRVDISAVTNMSEVSAPNVFMSQTISDGLFHLKITKDGLDATGTANVGKVPSTISLKRYFGPKNKPFQIRYEINSRIKDTEQFLQNKFGFKFDELDYVRGPVHADFIMTVLDKNRSRGTLHLDMKTATVSLLSLGWVKGAGIKGKIETDIDFKNNRPSRVPRFQVDIGGLKANGSATFAPSGKAIDSVKFANVKFGRTELKGNVRIKSNDWADLNLSGKGLDLSDIWSRLSDDDGATTDGKRKDTPKFRLTMNFDKLWLRKDQPLLNVTGTVVRHGDLWQSMYVHADVSKKGSVDVALYETDNNKRTLSVISDDAGATLRALDYYDNMLGGNLKITGTYDDADFDSPLTARLKIDDYRVIKAPVLARVVSILAITGIIESLQGRGLNFTSMEVPFVSRRGTVSFKEARASGPSLGFTASGSIYTHAEVLNLEGTVVPAYLINSFFGQIPVLGDIFTGGTKGGGIFAANFKMTGPVENPEVSVNPLSALAPGIFRNLFNIFDQGPQENIPEPVNPDGT